MASTDSIANTYLGTPCLRGHEAMRYIKDGKCVMCSKNRTRSPVLLAEQSKRYRKQHPYAEPLSSAKVRARKLGLPYNLSLEWAREKWTGKCELTGLLFVQSNPGKPGPQPFSPSIDRIDCRRGYTTDNCRFLLVCVNAFKGQISDVEMKHICIAILTHEVSYGLV
jgi:hypothetical protein